MYEKTLSKKTLYEGRILDLEVQEIEMENGVQSIREIIRHDSAVAILAMLPDERFVFVRQFRKAVEQDVLELIAGLQEEGETPAFSARREIMEETGYTPAALIRLGGIYPSPGYTEELIHLFFAHLEPTQQAQQQDDDERVDVVYLTGQELIQKMQRGEINDAKLLAVWTLYEKLVKDSDHFQLPCCHCEVVL